jgi:hypothetical protein
MIKSSNFWCLELWLQDQDAWFSYLVFFGLTTSEGKSD